MQSSCTDPLSRELSVLKLALALTQVLRTYISLLCLTILMLMAARWACDGQRRRDSSAAAGCSRIYAQCDFGADQAKAFRARGNSPADGDCSCYNVRFQEYLVIRSDVIISASLNGVRRLMRYVLHLISRGLHCRCHQLLRSRSEHDAKRDRQILLQLYPNACACC